MGMRVGRWIMGVLGAILLAALLILYTPPGLEWAGRLAAPLSGGAVRVEGLGGTFPNDLHAASVEVSDRQGVWLKIQQVSLRWSALAMISNHVSVRDVTAERITVLRRPVPSQKAEGKTPRLDIDHLALARIDLAAPVIGHAVTLSASGALHYVSLDQLHADLLIQRAGSSDIYRIAGGIDDNAANGSVNIREGAEGLLGKLAGLPDLGPVNIAAQKRRTSASIAATS